MKLCGLQKTTLLDYPGHVAATLFLGGCNFRCPFCHNKALLDRNCSSAYSEDDIISFLKKRSSVLEGVCITGGEPTLHSDLENFIIKLREMGFLIKLDTNGFRPQVLQSLCKHGLIDYVAMDIKSCRERYSAVSGVPNLSLSPIEESIDFLLSGVIPYEFRTTVVKELHTTQDFIQIGKWIKGCSHYYLQNYVDSEQVLQPGFTGFSQDELAHFIKLLQYHIPNVSLRGTSY